MIQTVRINRFQSVRFKMMIVYLLLILFAMELVGAYFIQSLNRYFVDTYSKTISHEAQFLANLASTPLSTSVIEAQQIQRFMRPFSELEGSSIYILDKDGHVVGTTANPFLIGQKRVDPEVTNALLGLQSIQIALDAATKERQLYLAVPVKNKGQIVGAVEFVSPLTGIYQSISRIIIIFATATLLALGLTAVLAAVIARTITGPIAAVTRTARALAGGDFEQKVAIHSNDEIGELASTFNMLVRRLRQAIASTEREKGRLQAIMSTMRDGVIATNTIDDILLSNPAATKLLNCRSLPGRKLADVLPGQFSPGDVQIVETQNRVLAVTVTALGSDRNSVTPHRLPQLARDQSTESGRVLVIRDVTQETRLEDARKRFVADVSHELRTPITVLKSYVEALLEGAYEDKVLAVSFLQVMDRETDRMTRLVTDLLQLSRFDTGNEVLTREPVHIKDLINHLAERYALVAFQAEIQFIVDVRDDAQVQVDRDRFEQVLDNVISNSLKYTPKRGIIEAKAELDHEHQVVHFRLRDTGSGIPEQELPHIFDRFYRVDKARSRQLGGTGLGLAIAREIIHAHGGEVTVDSKVDEGTTVDISLPFLSPKEDSRET